MHQHVSSWLASLSLMIAFGAQAQTTITTSGSNTAQTIRIYDPFLTRYSKIEGSPYIPADSVQNGWLVINNKRVITKLRYNSQTGEVEYIQQDKVVTPVNPVTEFFIASADTLHFRKGFPAVNAWSANDFYQVLFDGRTQKLVKHIKAELKTNTDTMQNDFGKERFEKREAYFIWIATEQPPIENYFLKLAEGQMKSVVASRKSVVAALPEKTAIIDRYLTEQKVKLKSWSELIGMLRYLETQ
ncbi:hypothetical protein GCM10028818_61030 [Spirosoma horti]